MFCEKVTQSTAAEMIVRKKKTTKNLTVYESHKTTFCLIPTIFRKKQDVSAVMLIQREYIQRNTSHYFLLEPEGACKHLDTSYVLEWQQQFPTQNTCKYTPPAYTN